MFSSVALSSHRCQKAQGCWGHQQLMEKFHFGPHTKEAMAHRQRAIGFSRSIQQGISSASPALESRILRSSGTSLMQSDSCFLLVKSKSSHFSHSPAGCSQATKAQSFSKSKNKAELRFSKKKPPERLIVFKGLILIQILLNEHSG
jgi:hypothetical protein